MCGRFAQVIKHNYLKKYLDEIANPELTIPINFNVAPTQFAGVIFWDNGQIIQDFMKWKLVPAWANDSFKYNIINTRIESIAEKPVWRGLFRHKRCVIPAQGFYEWHKTTKEPYFIKMNNEELMFMAGIFDVKASADGSLHPSFSILTQDANREIAEIHHRMPILIANNEISDYLCNSNYQEVLQKCYTSQNNICKIYPVSKAVNRVSNNYPELLDEYLEPNSVIEF